jgi:large subunit ribosomal protein L9e
MKYLNTTQKVLVPVGVTVRIKSRIVTVKGPRGEITKDLSHMPLDIWILDSVKNPGQKEISITRWFANYKRRTIVKTAGGIFKNMFNGVTRGYKYKMRCVTAHFPIKIFIAKDAKSVEFKNFLGGAQAKVVAMKPGCTISLGTLKDELIIDGLDVDYVSQTCALINQCVNVGDKDVRKFLDGIYVSERTFQDAGEQS